MLENVEDTKGVIRIRKSKKDRQDNDQKKKGQKEKQQSTKHTHKRSSNTNVTKNRGLPSLNHNPLKTC